MIKRIIGSAVRALLMALLVVSPSVILTETSNDAAQMAALIALVAAIVTFAEYYSEYPTFLEFREAPPFNRLRYIALLLFVSFASLLSASESYDGTVAYSLVERLSVHAMTALDIPFSPVHLVSVAFGVVAHLFDLDRLVGTSINCSPCSERV